MVNMVDSRCIVELKEIIENMNAELGQSHTKISELDAKVRRQEEGLLAAQKEMAKLQEEDAQLARDLKEEKARLARDLKEENARLARDLKEENARLARVLKEENARLVTDLKEENARLARDVKVENARLARDLKEENSRLARDLKESEEKCRAVHERLEFVEQKLAQFSLAQVYETNDDALDINSLRDEIILEIFGYLTQNQLGQIARVCKRWNVLTKSPLLWKRVNVKIFFPSYGSEIIKVKSFINGLPSCVTSIRLDFVKYNRTEPLDFEALDFEEICLGLQQKCPNLEELILVDSVLSNSLSSVIGLCSQFLQDVKKLIINSSTFRCDRSTDECSGISKIKILKLLNCYHHCLDNPPFSKLHHLKQLHLSDTNAIDSWFENDTSFLNQLHVLNVGCTCTTTAIFPSIQNHGHNLKELYLCYAALQDHDLNFNNLLFAHLETICLSNTEVTCEGVVSLIQSCPSLENVYVDEDVAESFAAHPFVVANRCKSGIVKAISEIHDHNVDYSHT